MVSADTRAIIERAKRLYAEQLQGVLEPQHRDRFVAIEPESGEYFLGDTFAQAVQAARAKHPARLSHTIRIGHRAALFIGTCSPTSRRSVRIAACGKKNGREAAGLHELARNAAIISPTERR